MNWQTPIAEPDANNECPHCGTIKRLTSLVCRRIGFNARRRYRYNELPASLLDAQGSQHSGYSFGCCFNHAILIHRFGWRNYAAQTPPPRCLGGLSTEN